MATIVAHAADAITIGNHTASREDAIEILGEPLESLPEHVRETRRMPLGVYRGLRFGLVFHPQGAAPDVYLEGATTRQSMLSREHHGPRAILNGLDRLANGYETDRTRVRQDLAVAHGQLRDYEARLGKPSLHAAYLPVLTTVRDELKACLSGTSPEPGMEPRPSVSELAERIKALKAANSIDAAPERIGKRRGSAEEPVTTRIRRCMESALAAKALSDADGAAEAPSIPNAVGNGRAPVGVQGSPPCH